MTENLGGECAICILQCNFGHCHGAFHPLCARDSGLYMSVKVTSGGRIQYRAYCDRHSPQQRAKVRATVWEVAVIVFHCWTLVSRYSEKVNEQIEFMADGCLITLLARMNRRNRDSAVVPKRCMHYGKFG